MVESGLDRLIFLVSFEGKLMDRNARIKRLRLLSLERISKAASKGSIPTNHNTVDIVKRIYDAGRKYNPYVPGNILDKAFYEASLEHQNRLQPDWLAPMESDWVTSKFVRLREDGTAEEVLPPKIHPSQAVEEDIFRMLCAIAPQVVRDLKNTDPNYSSSDIYYNVVNEDIFIIAKGRLRSALLYIDKTEDKEYLRNDSYWEDEPETWPKLYIEYLNDLANMPLDCGRNLS